MTILTAAAILKLIALYVAWALCRAAAAGDNHIEGETTMHATPPIQRISPVTPHHEVMRAVRLEAAHLAESVLAIFEQAFPDDLRPRMALPIAEDFATGLVDDRARATARGIAEAAMHDAAREAEHCADDKVSLYWAAADAAEAVMHALDPVVDITAVQADVSAALSHHAQAHG